MQLGKIKVGQEYAFHRWHSNGNIPEFDRCHKARVIHKGTGKDPASRRIRVEILEVGANGNDLGKIDPKTHRRLPAEPGMQVNAASGSIVCLWSEFLELSRHQAEVTKHNDEAYQTARAHAKRLAEQMRQQGLQVEDGWGWHIKGGGREFITCMEPRFTIKVDEQDARELIASRRARADQAMRAEMEGETS